MHTHRHTHTHPHTLPDSPPGSPGTGSSLVPISLTPSLIPSFPLAAWDLNGHKAQVRQWLTTLQHSPSRTKTILSLLPDIIWFNSFYISTLSQALCQGVTFKHGKLSLLKFTSSPKWLSLMGVYGSWAYKSDCKMMFCNAHCYEPPLMDWVPSGVALNIHKAGQCLTFDRILTFPTWQWVFVH